MKPALGGRFIWAWIESRSYLPFPLWVLALSMLKREAILLGMYWGLTRKRIYARWVRNISLTSCGEALELISSPNDQYRTIRVTHYPVGNAPQHPAPNTGMAMGAHGY